VVWRASYLPFGEVHEASGPASLDARFPGQWFMAETGLAYNWHRWYAAGLGRYTQPDPLGLEAGANRYIYANASPLMYVDPTGEQSRSIPGLPPFPLPWPVGSPENQAITKWCKGVLDSITSLLLPNADDEECEEEWAEARQICADELKKPYPNRGITGGYRSIDQCARGLVSERCGGNPVAVN
jgi:RHS repeat-associated protein